MEGGRQRSYLKAPERRAQILSRAIKMFAEHGVSASLRSIGESIGVSHAALRYHFPSRDDLLVEVYRAHEARWYDGGDVDDALSAVEEMEISARRNGGIPGLVELYATLSTDALQGERHPTTRAFIRSRFQHLRTSLAEKVRRGQRAGAIPADIDADDAAALVVAASDGLQVQWLLDPDAIDVRRVLAVLERLLPASMPDPDQHD